LDARVLKRLLHLGDRLGRHLTTLQLKSVTVLCPTPAAQARSDWLQPSKEDAVLFAIIYVSSKRPDYCGTENQLSLHV
jgi:hypothetical protein